MTKNRAATPKPEGDERVRVYSEATKLAMKLGQVTGRDSQYFVTLMQLENILMHFPVEPEGDASTKP